MKTLLLFVTFSLISTTAFAINGLKYVAGADVNSMTTFSSDGYCVINGFRIEPAAPNPSNTKELGWSLCVPSGNFTKPASITQITSGSYPGAYKDSSDIDPTTCRIDSSGIDANAATCGSVNP